MLEPLPFIWPLAGGLLVGLSAGAYLLLNGRVAGISGLIAQALGLAGRSDRTPDRTGNQGRGLGFIGGLMIGAVLASQLIRRPEVQITSNLWLLIAGGLLVGLGTRWGSGCTSGHGVCGLARLSLRSLVATVTFMVVAALTVFVSRHLLGGGV